MHHRISAHHRKRLICAILYEPCHEKTGFLHYAKTKAQISCTVTAQLINTFIFATQLVQSLYYHLLYGLAARFVWDLVGNPEGRFSRITAHMQMSKVLISSVAGRQAQENLSWGIFRQYQTQTRLYCHRS